MNNLSLPTPSFSLPATRVNPLRGFIRPALRQPGLTPAMTWIPSPPFKLRQPPSEPVWADEASSGTHPDRGRIPERKGLAPIKTQRGGLEKL
jgi:hypothetical protein